MTATTAPADTGRRRTGLAGLQRLGRSLMMPIAVLPAAAIILRLGQADMLGADGLAQHLGDWLLPVADVFNQAGNAIFGHLPLIFCVGVAIGFARKSDGSTALAAVVGYLVLEGVFTAMSTYVDWWGYNGEEAPINYGVLGGIIIGIVTALLWQKYYRIKLPDFLAFFGGRRFVPMIAAFAALIIGVALGLVYPAFDWLLTHLGDALTDSAVVGGGIFGVVNRLLIPLGLHHIINSLLWFQVGDYQGVHGDLTRFFEGDPSAGIFMAGFFPIMMFALPAAAFAIIHEAKPSQKKAVAGIMGAAALVSLVTGVTEPIEFSFIFVAWPLYIVHAILTGTSLALVNALDIHHGFGFSAGLIDYILNFGIAQRPLLIIPIGIAYAAVYYFLFRFIIRKWNLRTPGREGDEIVEDEATEFAGDVGGRPSTKLPPQEGGTTPTS